MMEYNENWERWCRISIAKHFGLIAVTKDIYFFVEGGARDTEDKQEYYELRVDGPNQRETAKDQWRLYFEVNILCACQKDDTNAYRINKLTGIMAAGFMNTIPVKKYGTGPEDDQALLGHLNLIMPRAGGEKIQTSYFGQINPTARIVQATVEGHYHIHLD